MKKIISLIAILSLILTGCGPAAEKISSDLAGVDSVVKNKSDFYDQKLDIIYNINSVPEDFWSDSGYGFEGIMNNKDVYNSRLENLFGKQHGQLMRPWTEYVSYGNFSNNGYKFTINKDSWLYTDLSYIKENKDITIAYLDNRLNFKEIHLFLEKESSGEDLETAFREFREYTKANKINGWNVFKHNNSNSYHLTQRVSDEFVWNCDLYTPSESVDDKTVFMSDEKFNIFLTKFCNSFSCEKLDKEVEFFHIELPEKYQKVKINDKITVDLLNKNIWMQHWATGTDYISKNQNIITVVDKNKKDMYQVIEHPEYAGIENSFKKEIEEGKTGDYKYIEKNRKDLTYYESYSYVLDDNGAFNGITFIYNDRIYDISYFNLNSISEEEKNDKIDFIFNNVLSVKQ